MSDDTATETTESTVAEAEKSSETNSQVTEPQTTDELPKWARDKLHKANNEAARYRHEAKEAAEEARKEFGEEYAKQITELTDAKAAVAAELENTRLESMKLKAALSVGIPGESAAEFADLLKGTTDEEIAAHAEKVKDLFGTNKSARATDPSQAAEGGSDVGLTPGAMLANFVRSN